MDEKIKGIIAILNMNAYHAESAHLIKTIEELMEYKKAYYSLKTAGVDLPHVKSV